MYVTQVLAIILRISMDTAHRSATQSDHLVLVTNDDGIASPGLVAAVGAALPLGEVIVVAPDRQWSGAGRSFALVPDGRIDRCRFEAGGRTITAYQVGASPAVTVLHALEELVPRTPSLVISGINFGENLGSDITHSGTVGAALQAAAYGIPALAVSLQTPKETHYRHADGVDFSSAAYFTRVFARQVLDIALPFDVDILKVDVPSDATPHTPWRVCRVSRHTYFVSARRGASPEGAPVGLDYDTLPNPDAAEPDSDIYALAVDRVVAVAPLSFDLSSRADAEAVENLLRATVVLNDSSAVL